jgi:hypothetical protein
MLSVRAATRSWLKTASRVRGRRGGGNASSKRATSLRAPNLKAKKLGGLAPNERPHLAYPETRNPNFLTSGLKSQFSNVGILRWWSRVARSLERTV